MGATRSRQVLQSRNLGNGGILRQFQEGDVLFVDEIHRLNRQVEEVLYPAMEDFAIDIMIGKGASARSIRLDPPYLHW